MVVIANPTAGGSSARRLARALATLRGLGHTVEPWYTRGPGDARPLAAKAARAGAAVIVAAGGDGTAGEVAAGILDACPDPGPGRPALGLLPLGTVNVLARDIGLRPRAPGAAARVLHAGHRRPLRPGRVDGRPFVAMASVGIDSHVVRHLDGALKKRAGALAYIWALLRTVPAYRHPPVTAILEQADGTRETLRGALVLVTRSRYYGGSLPVAPEADIGADRLTVVVLTAAGLPGVARYGLALLAGRLRRQGGVEARAAARVTLTAPVPLPVEADGDLAGSLPATVTLDARDTLDLIAPAPK
jgi:YegS/Rv2252/BmrU family lipid kinase